MTQQRFVRAIDDERPYAAHRYDVFGYKIGRRLTLFGHHVLNLWLQLEFDHHVLAYCERPLRIRDTQPDRTVDFWVRASDGDRFLILLRGAELRSRDLQPKRFAGFDSWANQERAALRLVTPQETRVNVPLFENRASILQHVAVARAYVTEEMKRQVLAQCKRGATLAELESDPSFADAMLARAAAFMLLLDDRLNCPTLASAPLSRGSRMVPT
jgi:hypothetical protein